MKDQLYHNLKNLSNLPTGVSLSKVSWDKLELISLHIPKTAGTSFYHMLKTQYGNKNVVRIDIATTKGRRVNMIPAEKAYVHPSPKVIHGHFELKDLLDFVPIDPKTNIITWLRHPVDRVISNYYYLSKILQNHLQEEKHDLNILSKMQRTLLEYASDEQNRNRMSKFLKGIPLEEFFFIGFVERFDQDSNELARKLQWSTQDTIKVNQTGSKKSDRVDQHIKDEIARLNAEDILLYERALQIRAIS